MANVAFNFQETRNPLTSVPNLASQTLNNTTDKNKLWVASVAGSNSITGAPLSYAVGDGAYWNGTAWVKPTAAQITPSLEFKIFVVPADFNWSVDLSSYTNTKMIVSNVHKISANVNLPIGVNLTFAPGGRFLQEPIVKITPFNLADVDWTVTSGTIKVLVKIALRLVLLGTTLQSL